MTPFPQGEANPDVSRHAEEFAERMRKERLYLDFSLQSLQHEIDRILSSERFAAKDCIEGDRDQAGLEAYVGECLARLFEGAWHGPFYPNAPATHFYLSYVEFGEYRFYPSHFLGYRISNGPQEGTFVAYLEKALARIRDRKAEP